MMTTTDTREAARTQLFEVFAPEPHRLAAFSRATVFALTRYQSRTRTTRIVDFLVIRDNRPISISKEIAAVLPHVLPEVERFAIQPGETYTGMVFGDRTTPEDIVNRLSMALFGRYCLDIEVL